MMRRVLKTVSTIAVAMALTFTGTAPLGIPGYVSVVNAESGTRVVKAANVDGDYSVTNGVGLNSDADGTAKLSTITDGDKALFKGVEFGPEGTAVTGITFKYSKPSTDSVKISITLDSENGTKFGEWQMSKSTKSLSEAVEETFKAGFNKKDITGKHDLYLTFSCSNKSTSIYSAIDLYEFSFSYSDDGSSDAEDVKNAKWIDAYKNKSNKNKPFYWPNIYLRTSYVVLRKENDYKTNKTIFGDPYAIKDFNSNIKTVDGISYDYNTNTLTLKNYNDDTCYLDIRNMGKTFNIKLVGKNYLKALHVSGANWPTNLHFTGKGSIVLNKSKSYFIGPGLTTAVLYLDGWHKETFKIDKKAKVTAYGYGKYSPVVLSYGEGKPALKKAVKISYDKKGKKLNGKFVNGSKGKIKDDYKYSKKTFIKK